MLPKEKNADLPSTGRSLSEKIISKMALMVWVIFLLTIVVSGFLSARSQFKLTNEKLVSVAYENAYLIANDIENSYGTAIGFAEGLRNISELDPGEQRAAIDNALVGVLEGNEKFTTVFAYFEQNAIADANGDPYSVNKREIAYEAIAYPNEDGTGYIFEKHEDAFDNYEKEYYLKIKSSGEPYIMEPYVYELMGQNIMMISIIAPVYDAEGNFLGVAGVDVALDDMQSRSFAGTGYASTHMTALAEDGTVLLDSADPSKVGYIASEVGYDLMMANGEKIRSMPEGDYVNSRYIISRGVTNFASMKKGISVTIPLSISGGNQWTLYLTINRSEFYWAIFKDVLILTIIVLLLGTMMLLAVYYVIKKYLAPFQTIMDGAARLEAGDLNINIDVNSDDELGRLAQAFNHISITMNNYVNDISQQLSEMASNNMDISIAQRYIGDFIPIQESIEKISQSLNDTLHQIILSADEVAGGSDNVSSQAQVLSHGVTEQAAAIDELAASIESLARDVAANADDAQNANQTVLEVQEKITDSNKEMDNLVHAMSDIDHSSVEIEKIVRTIEDIADQTNLLSLNASIEAARAGEAGRGFAIVANEIHDLAAKSAEAVSQTSALIEASRQAVERGIHIADDTAKSLITVVEGAGEVTSSVNKISDASQNQKMILEQLTQSIDLISSVVQSNSAAVQESASASAELSNQAKRLYSLVNRFRLKKM